MKHTTPASFGSTWFVEKSQMQMLHRRATCSCNTIPRNFLNSLSNSTCMYTLERSKCTPPLSAANRSTDRGRGLLVDVQVGIYHYFVVPKNSNTVIGFRHWYNWSCPFRCLNFLQNCRPCGVSLSCNTSNFIDFSNLCPIQVDLFQPVSTKVEYHSLPPQSVADWLFSPVHINLHFALPQHFEASVWISFVEIKNKVATVAYSICLQGLK